MTALVVDLSSNSAVDHMSSVWPYFAADEIAAAVHVLETGRVNYWTGAEGQSFEREFAAYCGVSHAVAVANGTIALELAFIALGLERGAEVIVSPRSFFASAAAAALRGLVPVFADVDPDSQNITAATIEPVLTSKTRAIVPVHLAGWPCDMPAILDLALSRGLYVVEDCAQAHGAEVAGHKVGSFGHINAFSFCQDKIMTTGGEGGMITTNDPRLWRRSWEYKDHGKSFSAVFDRKHSIGFRWLHESLGSNLRLTEIQSAIGRAQLRKLDGWILQRQHNAAILAATLGNLPALRIAKPTPDVRHVWYKWYTFVRPEALATSWSRDRIIAEVNACGIPCFSGTCPEIYQELAFKRHGLAPAERLPVAKSLGETSMMLLVHPTLDDAGMYRIAEVVTNVVRQATR